MSLPGEPPGGGSPQPEESSETFQVMDPALFANMPNNFGEYSKAHPEILPDYLPFAGEVLDLVDSTRPDQIIALTGPQGIGKSRLIVPAILKRAQERGYKPLGSVQNVADLIGSTIMIDAHTWLTDKGHQSIAPSNHAFFVGDDLNDGSNIFIPQWDEIRNIIHRKFTSFEGPKLFVIDEFAQAPLFLSFISDLARKNNVRLVAIGPLITHSTAPKEEEREDIRNQRYQDLHETVDMPLIPLTIPEQLVPVDAITTLLETFGIDEEVAAAFSKNPHLRRLAMVEAIVKYVFSTRKRQEPDDNTIVPWESIRVYGRMFYNASNMDNLGLTEEEFNVAKNDLFKKDESETSSG